jgi:hypothetical protein
MEGAGICPLPYMGNVMTTTATQVAARDTTFQGRVRAAMIDKAVELLGGTPTAAQQKWSYAVLEGDVPVAPVTWVIIENADPATVEAVLTSTDASLYSNLDAVIDDLIAAYDARN